MYQSAVSKHYLVKTKDSGSPWQGRGGGYGGRRGSGYNYNKPANIAGNDYSNDYQGEDYPDVGRLPDTPLLPGGDSLLPPEVLNQEESLPTNPPPANPDAGRLPDTPLLPGGDSLLPTNPPPANPDVGRLPDTPLLPGGDSLLPPESIPGKLPDTPLLPGGDSLLPTNPPPTEQTTTRDKIDFTGELLKAAYSQTG